METNIVLAPLQGFTGEVFRNVYAGLFEGIDYAVTPYLRAAGDLKDSERNEVQPENNRKMKAVPQILCNNAVEFIRLSKYLLQMGFNEVNWNLGCPYPMATRKNLGAGLLNQPEKVQEFLSQVMKYVPIKVSVKMRLGLECPDDILKLLPIMNNFPLTSITIHPRVGKQMYRGHADPAALEQCLRLTDHKLIYNGDIRSALDYSKLSQRYPGISGWMIGRGVLMNPFLPAEIKGLPALDRRKKLVGLHQGLLNAYLTRFSGDAHVLHHMKPFWEYFSESFEDSRKICKTVKKTRSLTQYELAVNRIFSDMPLDDLN